MSAAGSARPLRVRTRNDYSVPFLVDVGQRNAVFVKRKWTPLRRVFRWADAFAILPEPDFDMVHAVNAVPILTRRPYLLTFEDYLPRVPEDRYVGWLEERLQRALLSPRCVALLAISEYALRQFRWQSRTFPGVRALEDKMELLPPAVALRRTQPKRLGDTLKLAFVAHDFMHKAGPALVRAHARLRDQGIPVQTTIVSTLRWDPEGYVGPPSASYVEREVARLRCEEGVTFHPGLPNGDVLRIMDEADFFVFPTLHDTFGYVSLEALAGATPVIAAATCAQPEIVEDGRNGFLLPLENDPRVGKWVWSYRTTEPGYMDVYEETIQRFADTIADRLAACWEDRDSYEALSAGAIERVRERFDRDRARARLEELYERCRERVPPPLVRRRRR